MSQGSRSSMHAIGSDFPVIAVPPDSLYGHSAMANPISPLFGWDVIFPFRWRKELLSTKVSFILLCLYTHHKRRVMVGCCRNNAAF